MDTYVKVASTGNLAPGEMTQVHFENIRICLANVNGTCYAFSDECTDVGGALSQGELEGYTVTCPLHNGQFDVRTGKVLQGPPREHLATFKVKVDGQDILIARSL